MKFLLRSSAPDGERYFPGDFDHLIGTPVGGNAPYGIDPDTPVIVEVQVCPDGQHAAMLAVSIQVGGFDGDRG